MEKIGTTAASVAQSTGSLSEDSRSDPVQVSYRLDRAKLMCACYRKGEASDPELYGAAVAAVLADYSADVVEYVTDPRTGLPSKQQWLPTIKEIKEACDVAVESISAETRRKRDLSTQFAERESFERE